MKFPLLVLATALLGVAALPAQSERSPENLGQEKTVQKLNHILIQSADGETLGRIRGINLDLSDARIVEVFVVTGDFLGLGGKIVAVPPSRLVTQPDRGVIYFNGNRALFQSAPVVDISRNGDYRDGRRIAANARYFGVEPYFLEADAPAAIAGARPKKSLGHIERANKINGLPVGNLHNEHFGKVSAINFNLAKGTIQSVLVRAPGLVRSESVIPAAALAFNAARNGLILDDTKSEFAAEPRIVVTDSANGQPGNTHEEAFHAKTVATASEQGTRYADIDRTASIYRKIRFAKIKGLNAQVSTLDGRTVLRGTATSHAASNRAMEIAVAASRLENVDNQIVVTPPAR